jgi:hypothetical protein
MKKVMLDGEIMERILPSIYMAAEVSMEILVAGTTLGDLMASMALDGDGDGATAGDGAGQIPIGDGVTVDSTTHGTAPLTEGFIIIITALTTEMDMPPIIIEEEEIQAMPLVDLATVEIDPVFPTEVVILDQKLGVDQVELELAIETAV